MSRIVGRHGFIDVSTEDIWLLGEASYNRIRDGEARVPVLHNRPIFGLFVVLEAGDRKPVNLIRVDASRFKFDESGLVEQAHRFESLRESIDETYRARPPKSAARRMRQRRVEANNFPIAPAERPHLYHRLRRYFLDKQPHEKIHPSLLRSLEVFEVGS